MDLATLIQVILGGLATGGTYALVALGLILILNATSVPNFAHGEVGLFATYVGWSAVSAFGVSTLAGAWLGLAVSVLVAAVTGVVIGTILLWQAERRTLIASAVVTLGLFFAIHAAVVQIWGPSTKQFPAPFGTSVVRIGDTALAVQSLGMIATALLAAILLAAWLKLTRIGTISRAIVQNLAGATLVGLPTVRIKLLMWAIGSGLAGLAGSLIAPIAYLTPTTMVNVLVFAFASATLGGLGSLLGAFIGGLILGVLQSVVSVYASGSAADAVGLIVIVVLLVFRPAGLIGRAYVEKV